MWGRKGEGEGGKLLSLRERGFPSSPSPFLPRVSPAAALHESVTEPHVFRLELFSVEVSELTGVGGELETELIAAKGLVLIALLLVDAVGAVFAVSEEGVTDIRQMSAYLVGASRYQIDLEETVAVGIYG